jgi:hypothetical protein
MRKSPTLKNSRADAARRIFKMYLAVPVLLGIACSVLPGQTASRPGDLILADVVAPAETDQAPKSFHATSPTPVPVVSPAESANPVLTPSATPAAASFWAWFPDGLQAHLPFAVGAGAALLLALILILALLVRAKRKPKPDLVDNFTAVSSEAPPPVTEVTRVPRPDAPVLAWLVNLDADSTRHPITKTAVRIGRKQDNDLVMKNDTVSGHHAEILKRGDKFMIADLGASNGVFVRGQRVEKTSLENGDLIELGEVRLRFMLNQSDT